MSPCCPNCGQAIPEKRLGVRLTPMKARIFDLIRRGGQDGISRRELADILGVDRTSCLRAHIYQINELIADEGYRIAGREVARLERVPA